MNRNINKILQWNCNSLRNKLEFLNNYLDLNETEIIALNETNLNTQLEKDLRFHPGYNIIFKSRQNRSGGGVLLMIKKNIPFEIINEIDKFDTDKFEALCVEIKYEKDDLHIINY
jgi:exonuclease III